MLEKMLEVMNLLEEVNKVFASAREERKAYLINPDDPDDGYDKSAESIRLGKKMDACRPLAHELREELADLKVAYLDSLKIDNPLADKPDLTHGEQMVNYLITIANRRHTKVVEVTDDVRVNDIQTLCETLDQLNITEIAVIDHSSQCMDVLMKFISTGWKVVGNYESQLPVDERVAHLYKQRKEQGLLLQR